MRLKIDNPCNEDWNSMKIGVISRHCAACEKAVFDFTNKSKEEILTFLIQNQGKSVCGRLKQSQIDFHHTQFEYIFNEIKTQKNNKYAFAILSLACLAMVSCSDTGTSNDEFMVGKIETHATLNQLTDSIEVKDSLTNCKTAQKSKKSIKCNEKITNDEIIEVGELAPIDELAGGDSINSNVYNVVEQMPEFPGGMDSLFSFLSSNLIYPEWEKKNYIEGRVYVNFIVEKDGSIQNIKILRGVKGAKNFDEEVLRVMEIMPNWVPGKHNKKKVAVSYNLPITFSLKD